MKKRVLVVSESHNLNSGFGTYTKELLTRLHQADKYELAEFAAYGKPHMLTPPWLYYPNVPDDSDQEQLKIYNSNPAHQFGTWRFDKVCLDFKPDIVLCYRDPWMDNWIQDSPLRKYFHWVWMPTVDSAPQKQEWVDTFSRCDAVLAYSEFGGDVLKEQGKERVNYIGCASPGTNPDIYKPVLNTSEHRRSMGIDPDVFIVGSVMRNQKRKLFFELMKAFRLFLDQAPPEIAQKTFLYLHTSYPEKSGWDIGQGIMENNLGGKVLMTYICKVCGKFFPNMFQDALCRCKHCGNNSAVCPTVGIGLSVPDLAQIYNLFDIYAQYAICEGFGMPQVEASACGIPVIATDYSAMEDVLKHTEGYPVPVRTFFRELETDAERAYPDNQKFAEILINYFSETPEYRLKKSITTRKKTLERYNWDDTAKVWENYIDSYNPVELQGRWDTPPNMINIPDQIDENVKSNQDFIRWLYHLLNIPERAHQYEGQQMIRNLNFGAQIAMGTLEPLNRQQVWNSFKERMQHINNTELLRIGQIPYNPEPFIVQARDVLRNVTK